MTNEEGAGGDQQKIIHYDFLQETERVKVTNRQQQQESER
jgi:hypothetical protein